jgi:hypothetical protein
MKATLDRAAVGTRQACVPTLVLALALALCASCSHILRPRSAPPAAEPAPAAAAPPPPEVAQPAAARRIELPEPAERSTSVVRIPIYPECADGELKKCRRHRGLHYGNVERDAWGPSALYVDEQRTFWFFDGVAQRIAGFDASGQLVDKVPCDDLPSGLATGLAVDATHAFVIMDGKEGQPSTLFTFERSGKLLASLLLPSGATVFVPGRPGVLLAGALATATRLVPSVSATGVTLEPASDAVPYTLSCGGDPLRGELRVAEGAVELSSCLGPLRVLADGSLDAVRAQAVFRLGKDGTPMFAAAPPPATATNVTWFMHPAAGPNGELFAAVPHKRAIEVVQLTLGP